MDWKLQKPSGAEQYCYVRDEVRRMLQVAKALKINRGLYSTILLLAHTGMRIGEAQNLKWSDIDFTNEVLHIRDESFSKKLAAERRMVKGKKSRIVPMHGVLLDFLGEHRKSSGFVLRGDRGS